ncbi:uncharacterized protein LOC121871949 [Homarus americanus]|uniref:Carbohydrate sulfotransferase n=1 Tax=Homarus americanus TaxID=6706 RepID=A0A8J5MUM6_HOMAM|nr:uncharacterized protein LOC121871949 [Homarus americanus]XP_042230499.1 uncharacterized protein LOC121871949 [Homarus americanus]KAG7164241.1 putative Sulfotransferase domain-containing protein 6 [Homarus americanus]
MMLKRFLAVLVAVVTVMMSVTLHIFRDQVFVLSEFIRLDKHEELQGRSVSPRVNIERPQGTSTQPQAATEESIGQVLKKRVEHLAQVCRRPGVKHSGFLDIGTVGLTTPFRVCVVPKGGSTAWRAYMNTLKHIPKSQDYPKILVARHPLARLASVYRDKFLEGYPLFAFNKTFKKITGSRQRWNTRWTSYWLPALIHKGLVNPSPDFFEYLTKKVVDDNNLRNGTQKLLKVSKLRILDTAVRSWYSNAEHIKLMRRFYNASFSMIDFLEHVLWTRDLGMEDRHWAPVNELCKTCVTDYKFILHLENPEETKYVLNPLHLHKTTVPRRHISLGTSQELSDLRYYENVPKGLMIKIIDMYKMDLELFGYDKDCI